VNGECPFDKGSSSALGELADHNQASMVNVELPFNKGASPEVGIVVKEMSLGKETNMVVGNMPSDKFKLRWKQLQLKDCGLLLRCLMILMKILVLKS
jgi:hypothetical protein